MNRTIVAIDPGASGGIAVHVEDSVLESAHSMWETEGDIVEGLRMVRVGSTNGQPLLVIEEVGGFVKGRPAPGSAMFNFGRNFGFILGVAQSLGFRVHLVRPHTWQKAFGIGTKGAQTKTEWKNKLKAKAQQLYPHVKVTLATADALLILDYAKRQAL